MFKPCALIPNYNHRNHIEHTVVEILKVLPHVIIVDDASQEPTAALLRQLDMAYEQVTLIVHQDNQGKGGAVMSGFDKAAELGYTHAIQIDADGQHCLDDLPKMIEMAQANPNTLISGQPKYDDSVPKNRLYGRYITHVWVWIETLSLTIRDSMCGFRCYPLQQTLDVTQRVAIGRRMDFDTEIMVHMYWRHVAIKQFYTRVIYPEDGSSNFDKVADNIAISKMHTRLFFGMLWRLPQLLYRKITCRQPQP